MAPGRPNKSDKDAADCSTRFQSARRWRSSAAACAGSVGHIALVDPHCGGDGQSGIAPATVEAIAGVSFASFCQLSERASFAVPRAGALRQARSRALTARKELREHFSDPAVQLAGALK
jgi:hypothetical protein